MTQSRRGQISFFDRMEALKPNPVTFEWNNNEKSFEFSQQDFLCEGILRTPDRESGIIEGIYTLTKKGLYLFDVLEEKKEPSNRSTIPVAELLFNNPRLEKLEKNEKNIFGFKLTGYQGSYEFYCESKEDQERWLEKARSICVSFNITFRYNFCQFLGEGNFAVVHRVERRRDGAIFAIKTIKKSKIYQSKYNMISVLREIDILRQIIILGELF